MLGRPKKDIAAQRRFTANLNRIIADRNLTQTEIANALDLPQQAVSAWSLGKQMPTRKNMDRLAKYLDVDVDVLTS